MARLWQLRAVPARCELRASARRPHTSRASRYFTERRNTLLGQREMPCLSSPWALVTWQRCLQCLWLSLSLLCKALRHFGSHVRGRAFLLSLVCCPRCTARRRHPSPCSSVTLLSVFISQIKAVCRQLPSIESSVRDFSLVPRAAAQQSTICFHCAPVLPALCCSFAKLFLPCPLLAWKRFYCPAWGFGNEKCCCATFLDGGLGFFLLQPV